MYSITISHLLDNSAVEHWHVSIGLQDDLFWWLQLLTGKCSTAAVLKILLATVCNMLTENGRKDILCLDDFALLSPYIENESK